MTTETATLCRRSNYDGGEKLLVKSEDDIAPKHVKRPEYMPLSQLEELITCPIHLGMMEDPRIMACGHVFCLNCLQSCVASVGSDFRCPVCRQVANVHQRNLSALPPSIQTKQLTDCIVHAKAKIYEKKYGNVEFLSNESVADALSVSVENKRDLVRHLINEIVDYTRRNVPGSELYASRMEKVLECIESPKFLANQGPLLENTVVHSSNITELLSSNYELMDVETLRENMRKYSEYKLQRDVNNFLMSLYWPLRGDIASTHVTLTNEEPETLVWCYRLSSTIMVKNRHHSLTNFTIKIEDELLQPRHMQVFEHRVYVCGVTGGHGRVEMHYHLVQCSLSGDVVRRAVFEDLPRTAVIAGFSVDRRTGEVLVALPGRIAVLSHLLTEARPGYRLPGLQPEFVAHSAESGEIWATCPRDGRIVIVDEASGAYRELGTGQIHDAVPSDIVVTGDNRVLFLDCHANRVFWVRKRNDFILIQRISFCGHSNKQLHGRIRSMHSVGSPGSAGKLLLTTDTRICLVRPAKTVGEHSTKHVLCNIL